MSDSTRGNFLSRIEAPATVNNWKKAFKKFDEYLTQTGQTEEYFIKRLNELEVYERYNHLQDLIDFIKHTTRPHTTRNYFTMLFKYLLMQGVALDYTQKRIRLKLPRIIQQRFEGLDRENIFKLLGYASENFSLYMRTLAGLGTRETEGVLLMPYMFKFEENPVRVLLPAQITKLKAPRETFCPPKLSYDLQAIILKKQLGKYDYIYTKKYYPKIIEDFDKVFGTIRDKAGLGTKNRAKWQQNDITLHSLRAYFITTFTDHGLDSFGHALAGHTKDLSVYFRKSLKSRQETYSRVMNELDFDLLPANT